MIKPRLALRRVAVVLALLSTPVLFLFGSKISTSRAHLYPNFAPIITYFAWGISMTYPIIGVWLASREPLFRSASGYLRTAVYLSASTYGWVIFSAVQDAGLGPDSVFHFPGTRLDDFGVAALLLVEVALSAWLFWPIALGLKRTLRDVDAPKHDPPRITIRFLLGWTAAAAVTLTFIRILAQFGKPMNLGIAQSTIADAIIQYATRAPLRIIQLGSVTLIMVGFASRPRHWVFWILAAVAVQFLGQQAVLWATSLFADPSEIHGIFAGPWKEQLPLSAGAMVTWIATFAFARMTGLKFARPDVPLESTAC
jgi:hypothetical protein